MIYITGDCHGNFERFNPSISCMRCVGICPVSARKPGAIMVKVSALVLKKECSKRKKIGVCL